MAVDQTARCCFMATEIKMRNTSISIRFRLQWNELCSHVGFVIQVELGWFCKRKPDDTGEVPLLDSIAVCGITVGWVNVPYFATIWDSTREIWAWHIVGAGVLEHLLEWNHWPWRRMRWCQHSSLLQMAILHECKGQQRTTGIVENSSLCISCCRPWGTS